MLCAHLHINTEGWVYTVWLLNIIQIHQGTKAESVASVTEGALWGAPPIALGTQCVRTCLRLHLWHPAVTLIQAGLGVPGSQCSRAAPLPQSVKNRSWCINPQRPWPRRKTWKQLPLSPRGAQMLNLLLELSLRWGLPPPPPQPGFPGITSQINYLLRVSFCGAQN